MSARINVEVVYAAPKRQVLLEVRVDEGSTVAEVLAASSIGDHFPEQDLTSCEVGIWGRVVARDTRVQDGDRIELYRPLVIEPREARRLRAKAAD